MWAVCIISHNAAPGMVTTLHIQGAWRSLLQYGDMLGRRTAGCLHVVLPCVWACDLLTCRCINAGRLAGGLAFAASLPEVPCAEVGDDREPASDL
jgi:hypothetical protein